MRRFAPLLLLTLLCLLSGCRERVTLPPQEEPTLSPTSYRITASLDPEEKRLAVETEIVYSCPADDLAAVKLALYANAYCEGNEIVTEDKLAATYPAGTPSYGGAELTAVTVEGEQAAYDLGQGGTLLTLRLGRKCAKGEVVSIRIVESVALAHCRHRLGYAEGYFSLSDFYPAVCPFSEGKYLFREYLPYGDPFSSECADFTLDLTLPIGYECAASSPEILRERQGSTVRFSYAATGVRDFALVCSPKLRYKSGAAGEVPIRYYFESDAKAQATLAEIESAILTYAEAFGAYPYPSYAVVVAPFFEAGVEHCGLAVLSSALSSSARAETILHESAHQWWFGKVGNDSYLHPWMDEGLAEYAVAYYYLRAGEKAAYRAKIREAEDAFAIRLALKGIKGARFDLPLSEMKEGYYDRVYAGGLLLFASLGERLGTERFLPALTAYATAYEGCVATPEDLIASLSASTGEDLSAFFSAWLSGNVPVG